MDHSQRFFSRVAQVILMAVGLGAFICSQAAVPVESVTPSGYGSSMAGMNQHNNDFHKAASNEEPSSGDTSNLNAASSDWVGPLLNQVNSLQQQVQQLKGQLEEQAYQMKKLEDRSKKRYLDLDRRFARFASSADEKPVDKGSMAANGTVPTIDTSATKVTDAEAYNSSFKLIGQKKFPQAIAGFSNFVIDYPKSSYLPNAWYWLGEIYSVTGDNDQSKSAFLKVVANYPNSNKAADSMYKLGQIYAQAGDIAQAKKFLTMAIKKDKAQGSGSTARLAQSYLDSLK